MIVKGSARKDGPAMAVYFMESEDGARLLFSSDPMGDTLTAMTEWDEIGRLTKGEKPLYHMQLCPDAKYAVSDEQWKRMAEIVLEEIGAKGHDYELYFHPGVKEDGEPDMPHAHLGVCRTNRDTLKMFDLGFNYQAHERASLRIAKEMGMEIVPGKHAKRDRQKQKDFPRAEARQADHQQATRTELTVEQRREQVTALRAAADNAQAFKSALEDAGYVLAKGDKRGLVIVDEQGEVYSLSKQLTDIKGKDYKDFVAPLDPKYLPSVNEAKTEQERRRFADVKIWGGEAQKQGVEASKFLRPPEPAKAPAPPAAPPKPEILPEKPETVTPVPPEGWTQKELTPEFPGMKPPPAPPEPPPLDPEIGKLRAAILKRQKQEYRAAADKNFEEYRLKQAQLKNSMPARMEDFTIQQAAALDAFKRGQKPKRKGLKGLLDRFRDHIDPDAAAEREENLKQDLQRFRMSQREQRKDFIKNMRADNKAALDVLRARHLDEQKRREESYDEELERRLRDRQRAIDIAREQSEWAKDFEKEQEFKEGEEPPPPKLGK